MELNAPTGDHAFQEQFMYKSRLLEYAQKSAISSPEYHTVNEGHPHAPRFRSRVLIDGKTFTSHATFFHRRAAEHEVAKLAFESLSREIESEAVPLIQQDATFCKSILLEYAVKMKMEKPTYTTFQAEGILPVFISSSIFNGQTYTGDPAKNKKDAEQQAARAVIESILADSNTRRLMCEIVRSKRKLYSAFCKKSCSSGLPSERNFSSRSRIQNHPNDNVNGEELLASSTNNQVPANIRSGDEQIAKAAARETFTPEAIKSSKSNSSDGVKLTEPSTRPEDCARVVLASGMKRSDAMKNGGNASKKARTIDHNKDTHAEMVLVSFTVKTYILSMGMVGRPPTPSANSEIPEDA